MRNCFKMTVYRLENCLHFDLLLHLVHPAFVKSSSFGYSLIKWNTYPIVKITKCNSACKYNWKRACPFLTQPDRVTHNRNRFQYRPCVPGSPRN